MDHDFEGHSVLKNLLLFHAALGYAAADHVAVFQAVTPVASFHKALQATQPEGRFWSDTPGCFGDVLLGLGSGAQVLFVALACCDSRVSKCQLLAPPGHSTSRRVLFGAALHLATAAPRVCA